MLCRDIPMELLETISLAGDEPTEFLSDFFATGHTEWLASKYGPNVRFAKERIHRAVLLLWERTSRLHTSHILKRPDPDWEEPLFSDEGLF